MEETKKEPDCGVVPLSLLLLPSLSSRVRLLVHLRLLGSGGAAERGGGGGGGFAAALQADGEGLHAQRWHGGNGGAALRLGAAAASLALPLPVFQQGNLETEEEEEVRKRVAVPPLASRGQQTASLRELSSKTTINRLFSLKFITFFFCGGFCADPPPSPLPSTFPEREKAANPVSSELG